MLTLKIAAVVFFIALGTIWWVIKPLSKDDA